MTCLEVSAEITVCRTWKTNKFYYSINGLEKNRAFRKNVWS